MHVDTRVYGATSGATAREIEHIIVRLGMSDLEPAIRADAILAAREALTAAAEEATAAP